MRFTGPDGMYPGDSNDFLDLRNAFAASDQRVRFKQLVATALAAPGNTTITFSEDQGAHVESQTKAQSQSQAQSQNANQTQTSTASTQSGTQKQPMGAIGGPIPWYGNFLGPGPDGNPYWTFQGH